MKIIDLAEKQYNNEMLPKHIRYENEDLYFDGVTYYDKEGNNDFFDILAMNYNALTHLFDEVEIIEENKKIEKISKEYQHDIQGDCYIEENNFRYYTSHIIINKINELIDEVNKLKGDNDDR